MPREEVSTTMEPLPVTQLPTALPAGSETTEVDGDAVVADFERDQTTTDSEEIETLEKTTEPVNPADAENPGNTITTLGTNPETEIATEATVNIPTVEKIAEDDDAAVSTESTMDITATETISSENIAEESVGEKSDVIGDGSGSDGTKLVNLVTGTNLVATTIDNLVSTTLNPPQEQP